MLHSSCGETEVREGGKKSEIILWRSEGRRCWRCSKCLSRDSPAGSPQRGATVEQGRSVRWKEKHRGAVTDWPEPPFPLTPQGRRWRIPEWKSASGEGKRKRYFSFITIQLYFNLEHSTFMLKTSSVCFAMRAIVRWFPCLYLNLQVLLS